MAQVRTYFGKRLLDLMLAIGTGAAWVPLMGLTAAAVLVADGRPIFFRQERAGLGGKAFRVLKFRTMREGKVTGIGKWLRKLSLDEVPQMVNILRGDMSFVGPRPLPTAYLPRYSAEQAKRHEVRPGLTGLAQIHGRNALTWEEKFRYDVEYVEKNSFFGDIRIMLMTVPAAFAGGDEMEEFKGA